MLKMLGLGTLEVLLCFNLLKVLLKNDMSDYGIFEVGMMHAEIF